MRGALFVLLGGGLILSAIFADNIQSIIDAFNPFTDAVSIRNDGTDGFTQWSQQQACRPGGSFVLVRLQHVTNAADVVARPADAPAPARPRPCSRALAVHCSAHYRWARQVAA